MFRLIGVLVLMACLFAVPASHAKTFKIATISPDGLGWMKKLRASTKEIEKRTEGRVKFKIYPGGVQGDDFTVLRKMRIGQLHGGAVTASSLTRFYPDLQIYNLPLQFHDGAEVDFVRERMDQQIIDGLAESGIVAFSLVETGFAYLMTTKPVRTVSDLQDMKTWVPDGDPVSAKLLQGFGISPIPLSITDVLAGLQTGLVDAVTVPPIVALALQWHNHVDYVLDLPLVYIYSIMMLDKKTFDSLSAEDQAIVSDVFNTVFREIDRDNRKDNVGAYEALVQQDIQVVQPESAELANLDLLARQSIGRLVEAGELTPQSVLRLNRYLGEVRAGTDEQDSAGE